MQGEQTIYDKIRLNLPRGAKARIARKHKVARSTVTEVAQGQYENLAIMNDLLEVATATKNLKDEVERKKKAL